jgi:MFS family permease
VGVPEPVRKALRAAEEIGRNRAVRNVQIASVGSVLGTWAYGVALPVYAYHAGGARAVGLLFFARFVLAAIAAPWLGLLADRWSRRQLMLTADLVRLGIFAAMAAVAAAGGPALAVYVLAVSSTIVSGSYQPAQGALLPTLVDSPEELTAANLVGNTMNSVSMFAGPAIGGVLLALSGPAAVFALNGALFLWSAAFVVRVPRDRRPESSGERRAFLAELLAGFATVVREPALRVIVGLTAGEVVVAGALEVLLVVLALRLLHSGNAGVGWLNAALGVGSLVGAGLVALASARKRLAGGFALGILLWGIPIALMAAWLNLGLALVLALVAGAGGILIDVTGVTLMQRSADNEVLGRVFGALQSLILGSLALGSVAAPALVSWLGPRWALAAAGVFLPALLVPLWPALRRIDAAGHVAEEPLALLRAIPIFSPLPEPVLERLAAGADPLTVPAGSVVFSRGDPGDRFYAIAAGRASVDVPGEPDVVLEPGGFFGEIALLRDVPRTATVTALDELRLYAVAGDDFVAAVTGHAPSLEAAESVVAARLPAGLAVG